MFKFITGANVGTNLQRAFFDLFSRMAQAAHGRKNELGQNEVEHQDGKQARNETRCNDEHAPNKALLFRKPAGAINHEQRRDGIGNSWLNNWCVKDTQR